ncbi:MAG: phage holin family protein [Burkholderiales bacterium]|jgi:putative membrane protein|nr:phage holin family protein [Burkholderiales bacterium]
MQTIVRFLVFWGLNTLTLWVASRLLPGLGFSGPEALLLAGLAFGVVNTFLKPILFILTLPITFVTLGLFVLVLNTGILFLVAWLVPGFAVGTFWQAFFAALFISFFSFLLNLMLRGTVVRIKIDKPLEK